MRITLPRRWQRTRYAPPRALDEETLSDDGSESDSAEEGEGNGDGEGEEGKEEVRGNRNRNSVKPVLWLVMSVVGTLAARGILRGGFGESFRLRLRRGRVTC